MDKPGYMQERQHAIDFQLKLGLSDSDFLSLVRNEHAEEALKQVGDNSHTNMVARYSISQDSLQITGLLNEKFPINFKLKTGSKTQLNFLKLLCSELYAFLQIADSKNQEVEAAAKNAAFELIQYLEQKIIKSGSLQLAAEKSKEVSTIDLYSADFLPSMHRSDALPFIHNSQNKNLQLKKESHLPQYGLRVVDEKTGESILQTELVGPTPQFRLFSREELVPQLISGFRGMETEIDLSDESLIKNEAEERAEETKIQFLETTIEHLTNVVRVKTQFLLSEHEIDKIQVFFHWGMYGKNWVDEELDKSELLVLPNGAILGHKDLKPEEVGTYGLCVKILVKGAISPVWSTTKEKRDEIFEVSSSVVAANSQSSLEQRARTSSIETKLLSSLSSFKDFLKVSNQLVRQNSYRRIGKILYEITKGDDGLRSLVSSYHKQIMGELDSSGEGRSSEFPRIALKRCARLLLNIGIGEVVIVAPEGPHAIAGGLAQVVVGLSKSWQKEGVSCSIISVLYDQQNGSQHSSAKTILEKGIQILDRVVIPRYLDTVRISFGATRASGTLESVQAQRMVSAQVYLAEYSGIRFFFLKNSRLGDRLYSFSSGEDQFRKAIFLSRGALEIMRDGKFGISPDLVISNDWLSSLVPVLLKTDPRYSEHTQFEGVKTIHAIHNAGPAYQGRFFVNQFGEDLWPLLGVKDDHFFGLSDPRDKNYINLTAGAIYHTTSGVLTVSRPYAQQLLTATGGEGLEGLFHKHKNQLFGVSNGVDLAALRSTLESKHEQR
jgi:Starch synthase catalytic domain